MSAARKKPKKIDRTQLVAQVCDELGITRRTLAQYVSEGCPCTKPGNKKPNRYEVGEVAAWMQAHGKTGVQGRPPEQLSETMEDARLRKERAMAENWELRNKQILGETVNKEEYRRHWMSEVSIVKGKCRGLGASIAPQCVGRDASEIQGIIETRVEQIFRELAE